MAADPSLSQRPATTKASGSRSAYGGGSTGLRMSLNDVKDYHERGLPVPATNAPSTDVPFITPGYSDSWRWVCGFANQISPLNSPRREETLEQPERTQLAGILQAHGIPNDAPEQSNSSSSRDNQQRVTVAVEERQRDNQKTNRE